MTDIKDNILGQKVHIPFTDGCAIAFMMTTSLMIPDWLFDDGPSHPKLRRQVVPTSAYGGIHNAAECTYGY